MKRILIVNDEMQMGGVARIVNNLINDLDINKYQIDLLVLHPHGELMKEIPSHARLIKGGNFFNTVDISLRKCKLNNLFSKLRLIFYMKTGLIKKRIQKERKKLNLNDYDVELAAKEGFCTIFTAYGNSKLKLNWVQTDYGKYNYAGNHLKLFKKALVRIDLNIFSSKTILENFNQIFGELNSICIPNPIDEKRIKKLSMKETIHFKNDKINLIAVARFHPQKALDRIIRKAHILKDYYHLHLIGDGPLKGEYEKLINNLKMDNITLYGIMENPYPYIKASDLFVLCSLYEGYPTIVIESLLATTPILSTQVAGVNEQIKESENGFIIPNDEDELYNMLLKLKDQKALLKQMKENLKEYHYDNSKIISEFDRIFDHK